MKRVLVANRGEIAWRVMRSCREMGLETVAVASEADRGAPHARYADQVISLGAGSVAETYLNQERILDAAARSGADGIHPGYGFLSENAGFAQAVADAGLIFIGPKPSTIALMGLKRESKEHMAQAGVPVIPGYHGAHQDADFLLQEAQKMGFPVLIKASAGGGGKGMRVAREASRFKEELETAKREARSAFGNDTVILEKYLVNPRHIEFQVFGDEHGNVVHMFERECSIQRRHQKIIEETPSTALTPALRQKMGEAACLAARSVSYVNAGTTEFMLDEAGSFYFLEMNTRLQVEHPITECVCGLDLVQLQIQVARGLELPFGQADLQQRGHAMEARIYAEDPGHQFMPQTGKIVRYREPSGMGIRVDSGVDTGAEVSILYDPMLAKLVVWASDRESARRKMVHALSEYAVHGVKTNMDFLRAIFQQAEFREGRTTTRYLEDYFPDLSVPDAWLELAAAMTLGGAAAVSSRGCTGESPAGSDPWNELSHWRMCR